MSDQAIIDQFIAEYGQGIYRGDPNAFWLDRPVCLDLLGFGIALVVRQAVSQAAAGLRAALR